MIGESVKDAILDSLKNPLLFCDLDHIIRYMNKAAETHYKERRDLIGQSVLDCHNAASRQQMVDIFSEMKRGRLDERLITNNEKYRIYMRAIRDAEGRLLGYYERYEPPLGS